MKRSIVALSLSSVVTLLLANGAAGCGPADEPSDGTSDPSEGPVGTTAAALSTGIGPCTLYANTPNSYWAATLKSSASINCSATQKDLDVEVCMQQLVTGGWQTIGWTCVAQGEAWSSYNKQYSAALPYYTAGRWYRTWAYGNVSYGQATAVVVSAGCQGNGGSGCN